MARFLNPESTGMYRLNFDALDGDTEALSFADPIPEPYRWPGGNLGLRRIYGGGAPVSTANFPTRLRVSGRDAKLVDFNTAYHIYLVNRRFIAVVERFQAEIQSIPVECVWESGESAGEYYFFFTTILRDAVIREKTTATWTPALPGRGLWQPKLYAGETFTFDRAGLAGAHMWVDPNMPTKGALVSEDLYAALRAANIQSFYEESHFAEV